ncbi:DsbC family protein [Massilia glaciei]|uniref:Thiol:disulfide interchange protein n=1 Tax=Massilia glaciei TaxID=1524097 RepID=A0A2U2HNS5_9BURK|nr:DsbC family protein [Massilia glaciei]PWF49129.1 DsbC family protein [Massilia glaciei]
MVKTKIVLTLFAGLLATGANAQTTEDNIRKAIEPRLRPGTKIVSIKPTPYGGLYELRVPGEIIYTDKKGEYLFIGQVMEAASGKNLTEERLAEINKIKFSDLPTSMALKMVKGNGKRVMAIFEDPNCGYCKKFRKETLTVLENVTVYTYMLNILSPDSAVKSKNIWCSADRNKAWDEWMLNNKLPPTAPAACIAPNEQISELGRKYRIDGTPAIIFTDGSRIAGAVDAKAIEAKFATIK